MCCIAKFRGVGEKKEKGAAGEAADLLLVALELDLNSLELKFFFWNSVAQLVQRDRGGDHGRHHGGGTTRWVRQALFRIPPPGYSLTIRWLI